ncbi:Pre-mRNA-splicing factor dre4 [Golovinomyces cichoracearum]|uniref:Pre-mRNA-splicing factor dre4 n=1 Tax=Golovinomyces cichoracearum TaxID=62708 RepID=A0A420I2P1_9PEZI|nr:Pre-mRNA-splicing factor dre4 [Golovinomyces cichoracearum]
MLKSTHVPLAAPPLPSGWTEHKAPSGHSYYYNEATRLSTYKRPLPDTIAAALPSFNGPVNKSLLTANLTQPLGTNLISKLETNGSRICHRENEFEFRSKPRIQRPQPIDKPKSCCTIPGYDNWLLVYTKFGRRFVFNVKKKQSFWRMPDKLKKGILELDQLRIREKASALIRSTQENNNEKSQNLPDSSINNTSECATEDREPDEIHNCEDVETSENEAEEESLHDAGELGKEQTATLVEFGESDIAYQLTAMGEEYGLEPDSFLGENDYGRGTDAVDEASSSLFKSLLDDFNINPFSAWDKLIEDGKLVDDTRYTALPNMKTRKKIWEEWSRDKIKQLREINAKQEDKDPRIDYLAYLQQHATPKLYWPEFKRKHRKAAEMRDPKITDKDREKIYREHINCLKLPQATLKSNLSALLKEQSHHKLNKMTTLDNLPQSILTDVRYISLDPAIRDPLIEAYISTLPLSPEIDKEKTSEQSLNDSKDHERYQKALEDRKRFVAKEKSRQRKDLEFGREILREEEEKVGKAMDINHKGLASQLVEIEGKP